MRKTLEGTLGFGQKQVDKISEDAEVVDRQFGVFREMQTEHGMDAKKFSDAKHELRQRLDKLRLELDRYLADEYGVDAEKPKAFGQWRESHHPFHWFTEFYGIMSQGGFDVIIGNPPYVEIPKEYSRACLTKVFRTALERWSRDEDLYTLFVERSLSLLGEATAFGMILPLSIAFSTKKPFQMLRRIVAEQPGTWFLSHFDRIPSSLFGNEVRTRCTIALLLPRVSGENHHWATSALLRWATDYRDYLFATIHYSLSTLAIEAGIPKVASQMQADALRDLLATGVPLRGDLQHSIGFGDLASVAPRFPQPCIYVGGTAYNWFPCWRDVPETTKMDGSPSLPARTIGFRFSDEETANVVFALLCSSLGYWWWAVASDGFNLKKWLLERFPVSVSSLTQGERKELAALGAILRKALRKHYVFKDNKGRIGNYFLPDCNAECAAVDSFLAAHVKGLSDEFFEDVRSFNSSFSRAEISSEDEEDDRE